jgi:hypothetical protein
MVVDTRKPERGGVMGEEHSLFQCEHCGSKHGKYTECPIIEVHKLRAQLAAMREENERLETELRCICENDGRKLDEIKRLRDKAIIWHKWPGEKPAGYSGKYLVIVPGGMIYLGDYSIHSPRWVISTEPRRKASDIKYWAEIPRPEGE